jgi:hypothetical protein
MAKSARRYFQIVLFRVGLAVCALLTAAWAGHQLREDGPVWLIASIFAASASICLIWPLVVPAENRTMCVYSVGPAFFLAGMFLLPPGLLVLAIGFAIALSGIVHGTRAYRTVFQLSASILAFGGFALFFHLGPQPSDFMFHPAPRAGLELLIASAALVTLLIIRSIALRVEHGDQAPHWGAFQKTAIIEAILCLAFSLTITVLARIHLALLAIVYVEIGAVWWFLHRYHGYVSRTRGGRSVPSVSPVWGRFDKTPRAAGEGRQEEWGSARARKARAR